MSGQEVLKEGVALTQKATERCVNAAIWVILIGGLFSLSGCARLPYTTAVLHEDQRVRVTLQKEVEPAGYTHPVQLSAAEVASLLRGFSIRERQRLPLRWFAEEVPPRPVWPRRCRRSALRSACISSCWLPDLILVTGRIRMPAG